MSDVTQGKPLSICVHCVRVEPRTCRVVGYTEMCIQDFEVARRKLMAPSRICAILVKHFIALALRARTSSLYRRVPQLK